MSSTRKKVAVIGAGASGLTAIKSCLEEGLHPVCFERTDNFGGLWNFTPETREGQACVMKSTVINSSKEMMAFSDFPPPKHFATFMHNSKVWEYFRLYAENFNLLKFILFNTEILRIYKADDFSTTGRWQVEVLNKTADRTRTETFDAVMVCTGHHADPYIPDFPGDQDFQGEKLHSRDYKEPTGFENKRVVVIGLGNSAGDVAVELSRSAKQVFLSTRRGAWVVTRIGTDGMPGDMEHTRRFGSWLVSCMYSVQDLNNKVERMLNKRFDHEKYGLKPKHHFTQQHPLVNEELANRIAAGTIRIKPNVNRFTKNGVEFTDGTVENDIDVVIYATGYKFGYPFISEEIVKVEKNTEVNLYQQVFPPDLEKPSLAIIGLVQPIGSTIPITEMQSRWVTRIVGGMCRLPSREDMWKDIEAKRTMRTRRFLPSQRYSLEIDYLTYMDEIAELLDCKPDLFHLMIRDPPLAKEVFFGPCSPYQYRLRGPGAWHGARKAILSQWNRVYPTQWEAPDKPVPDPPNMMLFWSLFLGLFIVVLWWVLYAAAVSLVGA